MKVNKVAIIGRLTNEPELKENDKYKQVKFTVAVNRIKEGADYISCIAWNRTAEMINKYYKKGSQIALEGRIQTGSYEAHDGTKRYTTDVIVEGVTFIGSNESKPKEESTEPKNEVDDIFKDFGEELELSDSDLPF